MLKLSEFNSRTASRILSTANNERAALSCENLELAIICQKVVRFNLEKCAARLDAAKSDYRKTAEAVAYYADQVEKLYSLVKLWNASVDRNTCKRANYATGRDYIAARKEERSKIAHLMTHWDAVSGLWNFNGVNFG